MSGLARVLHAQGHTVTGSDRGDSPVLEGLRMLGMDVRAGHAPENVEGADVVVYSAAVPQDNPELARARERGIEIIERAEMLGRLMRTHQTRIAVAGTHGKTTTTAMIDTILRRAGMQPTTLVGGDVQTIGANAAVGDGSLFLAEACEAYGSFLHLNPSIAVITNAEPEHLEHYGTAEAMEDSFRQFVSNADEDGCVIACCDDRRLHRILEGCSRRIVWYGFQGCPEVRADRVEISGPNPSYSLIYNLAERLPLPTPFRSGLGGGNDLGSVQLSVPGEHNVLNSMAAAATALELGVGVEQIKGALSEFTGAGRRFEVLFDDHDIMVVDDYAHHPTEVAATINGAKSAYPGRRVLAVFQPHLYSRTQRLAADFAESLAIADETVVTSIYGSREQPIQGVSGEMIAARMHASGQTSAKYLPAMDDVVAYIKGRVQAGDIVLVMGAGDIRKVAEELAAAFGNELL